MENNDTQHPVMELIPDLVEAIGNCCDPYTCFELALASKEYYTRVQPVFDELEHGYFIHLINKHFKHIESAKTDCARLRRVHKLMRDYMRFPHVLKKHINLTTTILIKLEDWDTRKTMGKAKIRMYKKFFGKLLND